jgi:hypothetical protein
MTTITLPDALIEALKAHDVQDIDTFATGAIWEKLEYLDYEDHEEVEESEVALSEEEAEALAASNAQACLDGWESYKRGEYVLAKDYFAEKRAEWAELKRRRKATQGSSA